MLESRRFCLRTTLSLGLASLVLGLAPNTSRAADDGRSSASPLCHDDPRRVASTLTMLACSLRDGLPSLPPTTVVVSRPLAQGSPEGARAFAERLTLLLSSALGIHDGGVLQGPVPQAGGESILLVEPALAATVVQVNATLLGKRASVWARLRGEAHQVLAHSFASRPLDIELQSYLPKVPLVRPQLAYYAAPFDHINAIACGDVDADGALDVALANRASVAVGSLTVAGFIPKRVAALSALSEVAVVPLREPLASLWFNGSTLELSTTDRTDWLRLDANLEPLARLPHQLGVGPGTCTSRTALPPQTAAFDCQTPPKLGETTVATLDRHVAFNQASGKAPVSAWRDAVTRTLTVTDRERTWSLSARGAQLALGDLDHDGILEVVTSSDTLVRGDDVLSVASLPQGEASAAALWDFPVPGGIDAVAICPPDASAQSAIVFASNAQVGVVQ